MIRRMTTKSIEEYNGITCPRPVSVERLLGGQLVSASPDLLCD